MIRFLFLVCAAFLAPVAQALISAPEAVPVGTPATFTVLSPTQESSVSWQFSDGTTKAGSTITHSPTQSGSLQATATIGFEENEESFMAPVFVFESAVTLLAEAPIRSALLEDAMQNGIYAFSLTPHSARGSFALEEPLMRLFENHQSSLSHSSLIILALDSPAQLPALSHFAQNYPLNSGTHVAVLTQSRIETQSRIAARVFSGLNAESILITRPEALRTLVLSGTVNQSTIENLTEKGIATKVIDAPTTFSFITPLSSGVTYLLDGGVPTNVVLLVLLLPVIAASIAFIKQVIGLTTFSVYTPVVITLSLLTIGLSLGLIAFVVILTSSLLIRMVLKSYRLSYTPRMAIVLSVVGLAILALLVAALGFASRSGFASGSEIIAASIFPMLIMSTLAERVVSIQVERGIREATFLLLEFLTSVLMVYFFVSWSFVQNALLAFPELTLLFLFFSVALGRYTGLRLSEYIRFRDMFKNTEHEE